MSTLVGACVDSNKINADHASFLRMPSVVTRLGHMDIQTSSLLSLFLSFSDKPDDVIY